jgi:hypothetical protein
MATPDPHTDPSLPAAETVRLRDAQEVLTAVPYLLGFQPADCLVVLALDQDSRLRVAARAELPDTGSLPQAVADLERGLGHVSVADVFVIGYCHYRQAEVVTGFAAALPWPVRDLLLVQESRWWALSCTVPDCCPAGEPVRVQDVVAASLLATTGAPAASRERLAAVVQPGPQPARDAVLRALLALDNDADPAQVYATVGQARAARADGTREVTAGQAAALLHAVADVNVRDACTLWADDAAVQLWLDLLAVAPDGWAAPVATLLAVAVYQRGDGALATIAIQRALRDIPGYGLACLIDQAITDGIPPQTVTGILLQALAEHPFADLTTPPPVGRRQPETPRVEPLEERPLMERTP